MAPKKPAKKPSSIKAQAVSGSTSTPATGSCATGTCGCATGGTCPGCDGRCACKTLFGCHFLGVLKQKKAIAGIVGSFIVLTLVQMVVHGHLLMPAYQASSALWLPQEAMHLPLIYAYNVALAAVFTMLFYVAQKFGDYCEGIRLGMMIMAPVALYGLVVAATQPIPANIIWAWSLTDLVQGALMGIVLTALGRCSCCAGKWFGACGKNRPHLH